MIKNYKSWISESRDFKHLLTSEQLKWCKKHLHHWSVDEKGFVNIKGSVYISYLGFSTFPVKFGIVSDHFSCNDCTSLTTLEGAPYEVSKDFYCYDCTSLTSLEGAPLKVGGSFDCEGCISLLSLEGAPQEIGGVFNSNRCLKLPKEQIEIAEYKELFIKWLKSGLPADEFLVKTRGTFYGKNFGI